MNPQPIYQDEHVTLYKGDSTIIAPEISADIIVTDPPYGINVVKKRSMPGSQQFTDIHGDSNTDIVQWMFNFWYPQPMYVFGANNFPHLLPESGTWSCWDKRCNPNADRMFGSPFELAWQTISLGKQYRMHRIQHGGVVNADGHNMRRIHPTQKPVILMEHIINHLPEGIILDPFAGSASTLIAARNQKRQAIGIEINEEYCEAAITRLNTNQPEPQPTLFDHDN